LERSNFTHGAKALSVTAPTSPNLDVGTQESS
jgi:hypothetical protein